MLKDVVTGMLLPFAGTALGAACVFFMRDGMGAAARKAMCGFASGIMTAASFFSLILPSLELSQSMGRFAFVPTVAGFLSGMLFIYVLDVLVPHINSDKSEEGVKSGISRTAKLIFAVTLHNVPEGMAVGIAYAGCVFGGSVSLSGAFALSLGIALQNFPEGAIVSMPLCAEGMKKPKTFAAGVLSGAVEPVAAALAFFAAGVFLPVMPYLLALAAGAMFYVVVEQLIPATSEGAHSNAGTVGFALGFVIMTALDVCFG